jgi:hypothetical protein
MQKLLVAYHSVRRITKSSDNLARWRGCSLPILPIADILADSVSRPCSHRWSSLRRSRPTPLSNMRILPRSEISGFLRCVLTVPPCELCSCRSRQLASKRIPSGEDSRRRHLLQDKADSEFALGPVREVRAISTARAALSVASATFTGCDT